MRGLSQQKLKIKNKIYIFWFQPPKSCRADVTKIPPYAKKYGGFDPSQ